MYSMDENLRKIIDELENANLNYRVVDENILIDLPNNFGTLEICIWNDKGEDSIQLLEGDYHTHGDIEAREYVPPISR